MAGEWVKFECSLPDKPETLAITATMGWDDPDLTVGKLMRLFRWFDQHTTDGNAAGVTPLLLDRLLGATGFVQAVANAGWMEVDAAGLRLKNFDRHNGATAKTRAQTAKRVANHRSSDGGNAPTVTDALAREEKKREEKKEAKAESKACRFRDFMAVYPRKENEKTAEAKWKAKRLDAKADEIIADVIRRKAEHRTWLDGFVPYPGKYITEERWNDAIDTGKKLNHREPTEYELRMAGMK